MQFVPYFRDVSHNIVILRITRYLIIMCLFQFQNKASLKAKLKGIDKFDCGGCPECLQKKSRLWALRCAMEAQVSVGVMVTLTYDTYKYESEAQAALDRQELERKDKLWTSRKFEELPPDPTIPLSKRHCQLFMKRLRKAFPSKSIKYLITAERGKKTNRAHYHALLFGVQFDDLIKYKKSDRGNWIYKSKTLEKIWKHGICTVDCVNLSAKTARYCTKYCAKDSGADDTFMLFSHGIGEAQLLKKFNGLSYWIEGREYAIPKQVWNKFIENKYNIIGYSRYTPKKHLYDYEKALYNDTLRYEKLGKPIQSLIKIHTQKYLNTEISHARGKARNEFFQAVRDADFMYKRYLKYWKQKSVVYELTRPPVDVRILSLPTNKYRSYKIKSLISFNKIKQGFDTLIPRSKTQGFIKFPEKKVYKERSFAPLSRHYRANDTIKDALPYLLRIRHSVLLKKVPWDGVLDREAIKYFSF